METTKDKSPRVMLETSAEARRKISIVAAHLCKPRTVLLAELIDRAFNEALSGDVRMTASGASMTLEPKAEYSVR